MYKSCIFLHFFNHFYSSIFEIALWITALSSPYIAHEWTAQNLILSVRLERSALCLKERHRSQNEGSLKSKERYAQHCQWRAVNLTSCLSGLTIVPDIEDWKCQGAQYIFIQVLYLYLLTCMYCQCRQFCWRLSACSWSPVGFHLPSRQTFAMWPSSR